MPGSAPSHALAPSVAPSQPPRSATRTRVQEAVARVRWVCAGLSFGAWVPLLWLASLLRPAPRIHAMMRLACACVVWVTGTRLRVRGLHHLPATGGFLLVSNHVNSFDPMVLYMTVPRHMIALEKKSHFSWPFYGGMIRRWGNLPVAPRDPELASRSLARAAELLRAGTPVFVFPEGTRSRDGQLGTFRKGSFTLAIEAQVPLIPVILKGADRVFREGTSAIYGGVQEVIFAPPILLERYEGDHQALAAQVRSIFDAELAEAPRESAGAA